MAKRNNKPKTTCVLSVTIPIPLSEAIDNIVEEFPKHNSGLRIPKSQVVANLLGFALDVIAEKSQKTKEEIN